MKMMIGKALSGLRTASAPEMKKALPPPGATKKSGTATLILPTLAAVSSEGWCPCAWPAPGQKESLSKVSSVVLVKHGDTRYAAGSGMYDVLAAGTARKFPGDAIYSGK